MKTKEQLKTEILADDGVLDCHTHVGLGFSSYLHGEYPYCMSVEDMVIRMKYLGISRAVMMPFAVSSYFKVNPEKAGIMEPTDEFAKFPYQLENSNLFKEIYEVFPEYSDMALPFIMFDPSREQEQQVELMEELLSTYPVFGLKTVTTYIQSFVTDLEKKGQCILDFAKRYDLPFIFHSSWDKQDPWANVFDLIAFAERHPELRICLAHSARFAEAIIERAEKLDNCYVDLSAFDIHCQLACQNHRAIADPDERLDLAYSDPAAAMQALAERYPKSIIWGTDMPYNYFIQKYYDKSGKSIDVELKSPFNREKEILEQQPQTVKNRISNQLTKQFLFGS